MSVSLFAPQEILNFYGTLKNSVVNEEIPFLTPEEMEREIKYFSYRKDVTRKDIIDKNLFWFFDRLWTANQVAYICNYPNDKLHIKFLGDYVDKLNPDFLDVETLSSDLPVLLYNLYTNAGRIFLDCKDKEKLENFIKNIEKIKKAEEKKVEKLPDEKKIFDSKIYLNSTGTVKAKQGYRFITIGFYYDDSDAMVDYFDRHRQVLKLALTQIPDNKKRTEKLYRSFVEHIPELATLEWKWHKEQWSMGHGIYLQSEVVGRAKATTYSGYKNPPVWLEISDDYYKEMEKCQYYFEEEELKEKPKQEKVARREKTIERITEAFPEPEKEKKAEQIFEQEIYLTKKEEKDYLKEFTIVQNKAKKGIEVSFKKIPSIKIRDYLKSNGFRWSSFNKIWYVRDEGQINEIKYGIIELLKSSDEGLAGFDMYDEEDIKEYLASVNAVFFKKYDENAYIYGSDMGEILVIADYDYYLMRQL